MGHFTEWIISPWFDPSKLDLTFNFNTIKTKPNIVSINRLSVKWLTPKNSGSPRLTAAGKEQISNVLKYV